MNKQQLIRMISEQSDVAKGAVERVLQGLEIVATAELSRDGEVPLPGIGKLKSGYRAARTGRNPQNGEPVEISAARTVKLSAASPFKAAIQ